MNKNVDDTHIRYLENTCNANARNVSLIQSLWSGYGACFRATLHSNSNVFSSPIHIVAKCATPPEILQHPKGWNSEASHKRKLASFEKENSFYQHLQPLTNEHCKVPQCIAVNKNENCSLLVMEDLKPLGYSLTTNTLSVTQAETVLKWLGTFHAQFVGVKGKLHNNVNVWHEGSYWHFSTRQDEFNKMENGPLKNAASTIARKLSDAKYQTLIHGDAKVANFCFTEDFSSCAAVDFQYVGYGVGVKDVAYFLGSALTTKDHIKYRDQCLNRYFLALEHALKLRVQQNLNTPTITCDDIPHLISEWRYLYAFACADFYRFLAGWSPQHWKIDEELKYQTHQALYMLNQR